MSSPPSSSSSELQKVRAELAAAKAVIQARDAKIAALEAILSASPSELVQKLQAANRALAQYRAPDTAVIFRGPEFDPPWGVMRLFLEGLIAELLAKGGRVQADIMELQRLYMLFVKDRRVWTLKENGFHRPPTSWLHTKDEPAASLRRPVMVHLKKMQDGSVKIFCEFAKQLSETCYDALPGKVFNPGRDTGDFKTGFHMPACFAGKSGQIVVPADQWTPDVTETFKTCGALYTEAKREGGRQIPGVPDLRASLVCAAGIMALRDEEARYSQYQYAACICQISSFDTRLRTLYENEPATVHVATIKSENRHNAKCQEYAAEGKPSPKAQHVKDVIRWMVKVAGHPEMKRAHHVLTTKCKVRSMKNRVTKATHDILCIIELENGVLAEVQIGFRAVSAMKAFAHVAYQYSRVDTRDLDMGVGLGPLMVQAWSVHPAIFDIDAPKYIADLDAIPDEDLRLVSMA